MTKTWLSAAALLVASLGTAGGASAGQIYSSGSFTGTVSPWTVSANYEVSAQFVLSDKTSLSSAEALFWSLPSQAPATLNWRIGTSEFGADKGSSTGAALTNSGVETPNSSGYNTYASSFAIAVVLDPGAYWLTLSGVAASGGGSVFWGDNGGSSVGKQRLGSDTLDVTPRVAFRLYGDPVTDPPTPAVPEPASLTLLGLGVGCGLLVYRRRKGGL